MSFTGAGRRSILNDDSADVPATSTVSQPGEINVDLDLTNEPPADPRKKFGPWLSEKKEIFYMKNVDAFLRLPDGRKGRPIRLAISPGYGMFISEDLMNWVQEMPLIYGMHAAEKFTLSKQVLDQLGLSRSADFPDTVTSFLPGRSWIKPQVHRAIIEIAVPVIEQSALFGLRIHGIIRRKPGVSEVANGEIDMWIGLHGPAKEMEYQRYFRNVTMANDHEIQGISLMADSGHECRIRLNDGEHPDFAAQRGAKVPRSKDDLCKETQGLRKFRSATMLPTGKLDPTFREYIPGVLALDLSGQLHVRDAFYGPSNLLFEGNVTGLMRLPGGHTGRQMNICIGPGRGTLISTRLLREVQELGEQSSFLRLYPTPKRPLAFEPSDLSGPLRTRVVHGANVTIDVFLPLKAADEHSPQLLALRMHAGGTDECMRDRYNDEVHMFVGTDQIHGSHEVWQFHPETADRPMSLAAMVNGRPFHILFDQVRPLPGPLPTLTTIASRIKIRSKIAESQLSTQSKPTHGTTRAWNDRDSTSPAPADGNPQHKRRGTRRPSGGMGRGMNFSFGGLSVAENTGSITAYESTIPRLPDPVADHRSRKGKGPMPLDRYGNPMDQGRDQEGSSESPSPESSERGPSKAASRQPPYRSRRK